MRRCSLTGNRLFAPIFIPDEFLAATGDAAWLQALLDAEAALAWAEAECGVVPGAAAEAIAACCQATRFDPAALGRAARSDGNPVIPLVSALRGEVAATARSWVHWGATSQDILDTAAMLVAARTVALIDAELVRLAEACAALARTHRDTVMAGRTLLQQALPITFGLKAAGWLAGVDDARIQLGAARAGLAVQLGGAAGTLASLGSAGPAVLAAFARRLGLAEPLLPWHTARQRISGLAGALGTVAGTAAKISADVVLLAQTEVAEVAEQTPGGSSTLPHKRNPAVVGRGGRRGPAGPCLGTGTAGGARRRARACRWGLAGRVGVLVGVAGPRRGAAGRTGDLVEGLRVHRDAMAANLATTGGVLLAERVVLTLASITGDQTAARIGVDQAVEDAGRRTDGFAAALSEHPLVGSVLSRSQIDELLDPAGYLGATAIWIERALAAHDRRGQHGAER